MKSLSICTASAVLSLVSIASGQPTSPTDNKSPTVSNVQDGSQSIPLTKRGAKDLKLRDGSLDWSRVHAHLAKAQSKYSQTSDSYRKNLKRDANAVVVLENAPMAHEQPVSDSLEWGTERMRKRSNLDILIQNPKAVVNPKGQSTSVTPNSSCTPRKTKTRSSVTIKPTPVVVAALPSKVVSILSSIVSSILPIPSSSASKSSIAPIPTPTISKTAGEPLANYNNGELWTGSIQIGTPQKAYTILFDTGSADTWIPSINCTTASCVPHKKYDPSTSSTSISIPNNKLSIRYGDGSTTVGSVWKDVVTVAGMTASSQTFGAANSLSADWTDDPMDGLMGMAFQAISQMNVSPFFQTLMTESKVAAAQFSFKLATPAELFLGGLNSALYMVASTVWYPVTTKAYWMITGAATVNGAVAVDSIDCIIDTGTSVVVAPTAAAAAYWNAVPNSASYGGGYYTFDCNNPPTAGFTFKGATNQWTIQAADFNLGRVSSGSTRCVGAIVGADLGLTSWVIGDVFLKNTYVTFDFTRAAVGFSKLA